MRSSTEPNTYWPTVGGKQPENYAELQDQIRHASKRDAVAVVQHVSGKTKSWCERNLRRLMDLGPEAFERAISYVDPTGERAVRNVIAGGDCAK